MFEQLLKLYVTSMATGVTSPMPHIVGPPGSGKSTVCRELADTLGVKLHTLNVSRISPLELEGLQMPDQAGERLNLLLSTIWTQLKDGDILLLDEFLRGFPEVYNGLLDILTAREVAGHQLPNVFIIGASNSVATYDSALEDRLLHIMVPDPRKRSKVDSELRNRMIAETGLNPEVITIDAMDRLMLNIVLPTYDMLDVFVGTGGSQAKSNYAFGVRPRSLRHLIGQVKLRLLQTNLLKELIETNNMISMRSRKPQYVILTDAKAPVGYESEIKVLLESSSQLSPIQELNARINLNLITAEAMKRPSQTGVSDDDPDTVTFE